MTAFTAGGGVAPSPEFTEARAIVSLARGSGRRRAAVVAWLLLAGMLLAVAVNLSVGDFPIPLGSVIPTILGFGEPGDAFIVHTLRLPRLLTGLFAGLAFGMSGAIFQTMARNPLASPDILGITAGASTAAVFVITVSSPDFFSLDVGGTSLALLPLAAFFGALVSAVIVYALAYRGGGVTSYRLVLIGIGIGAVAQAVTEYLLTRATVQEAASSLVWLTGSLNSRGWVSALPIGLALVPLVPISFVLARRLTVMQLGDDTANGLGVDVERSRRALVLAGVALAGLATAAAGPIAFVAFMAPPIARRLARSPGPSLLASGLAGALLVLVADLIGRRIFASTEIPVGVVTGVVGGPYLLWLLSRSNRIGRGG